MANFASFSYPGRAHENQDSLTILESEGLCLLAIADGIGGMSSGDRASLAAIDAISDVFQTDARADIEDMFAAARETVIGMANCTPTDQAMGTTLTVCIINGLTATFGHVGDTRLYHLRDAGIVTRTKDQTELQHLLDQGILTKAKARHYRRKNILLSAISTNSEYQLQSGAFELKAGDRIVLMTDGAYSLVNKRSLRDLSINSADISSLSAAVEEGIRLGDVHDDFSAVFYQV